MNVEAELKRARWVADLQEECVILTAQRDTLLDALEAFSKLDPRNATSPRKVLELQRIARAAIKAVKGDA